MNRAVTIYFKGKSNPVNIFISNTDATGLQNKTMSAFYQSNFKFNVFVDKSSESATATIAIDGSQVVAFVVFN